MNWLIFAFFVGAFAETFGNFVLKSQLTTYSNTLLQNTVYVLTPEGPDETLTPSSVPTSLGLTVMSSTSIMAPTPTMFSSASIPKTTSTPTFIASSHATSTSLAALPSSTAAAETAAEECTVPKAVTAVVTSFATRTVHRVFSVTKTSTKSTHIYHNGTTASAAHSIHITSTGTITSTITSAPACGCSHVVTKTEFVTLSEVETGTATRRMLNTNDSVSLKLLEAGELLMTTVNGSTLSVYVAVQTPVWPFYFNDFPETGRANLPTTYPPARLVVPPQVMSNLPSGTAAATSADRLTKNLGTTVLSLPSTHLETEPTDSSRSIASSSRSESFNVRPLPTASSSKLLVGKDEAGFGTTFPPATTPYAGPFETGILPSPSPMTMPSGVTIGVSELTIRGSSDITIPSVSLTSSPPFTTQTATPLSFPLQTSSVSALSLSTVASGSPIQLTSPTQAVPSSAIAPLSRSITIPQIPCTNSAPAAKSASSDVSTVSALSTSGFTSLIASSSCSSEPLVPTTPFFVSSTPQIPTFPTKTSFSVVPAFPGSPTLSSSCVEPALTIDPTPVASVLLPVQVSVTTISIPSITWFATVVPLPPNSLGPQTLSSASTTGLSVPASVTSSAIPVVTAEVSTVSRSTATSEIVDSSSSSEFECAPLNSENDKILVCKKNMQPRVKPPPLIAQVAIYCAIVVVLML